MALKEMWQINFSVAVSAGADLIDEVSAPNLANESLSELGVVGAA